MAEHPPEEWTVTYRHEYLDWAEKVAERCRGENDRLESVFDEALREARSGLEAEEAGGTGAP